MGNCSSTCTSSDDVEEDTEQSQDNILITNSCPKLASIYSQKGTKDINQDSALFYQGFGAEERSFFGVFDGHGKDGQIASRLVRDRLPELLLSQQEALAEDEYGDTHENELVSSSDWRRACISAYKVMDKEIKHQPDLECSWSGSTAVTIIMQGEDLIISNLGDSRAILGIISDNSELVAVQLTTDLTPDLPHEAERIMQCNGRIFALEAEPSIQRVWLPNTDLPGLAMTRCFGDFGVKNYGIIPIPQMTYHQITSKDHFLVLATDGVWDVLTNDQVAAIVWGVKTEEKAARAIVDAAVLGWKEKFPSTKIDDCTALCLFLQETRPKKQLISKAASTSNT